MPLAPGTRLGPYEIVARIGAGGMGEVYRAKDTKLKRDVAIKVLPEAFAGDPDRMARFQREAEVLASLNHPNIAQIYGVEERALVMELVVGETLKGPLPIDAALNYAKQIADALEAAHEKGIVHRDLKPANVMVTSAGLVKVLDFGLAAVIQGSIPNSGDATNSPTLTMHATQAGMIMGTAAYMSPEQARGKSVDKRADIWAFGVVLYEMLTGKQLFHGDTITDVLAAVVTKEPDWKHVPSKVQRLLKRCLEKDPTKRLRDISGVALLLEEPTQVENQRRKKLPWVLLAAATASTIVFGVLYYRTPQNVGSLPKLAFTIAAQNGFDISPVISPDGSSMVYRAARALYLRRLASFEVESLHENSSDRPFWSPDSKSIAFSTSDGLSTMRVPSGAQTMVAKFRFPTRGGTWSEKGIILLAAILNGENHLYTVPENGGDLRQVEVAGLKDGAYLFPQFLPGGEDFVFAFRRLGSEEMEIYLATLQGGKVFNPLLLMKNDSAVQFTPALGGHIFFVRNDALYAQHLDLRRRRLEGDLEPIRQAVASRPGIGYADFSISRTGLLAWQAGKAALAQVTQFDRQGHHAGTAGVPGDINKLSLSPDETHLLGATERLSWLFEASRPGRISLGLGDWHVWSPDGLRMFGKQGAKVVERSANGSGDIRELSDLGTDANLLQDVSPDGKLLLYESGERSLAVFRLGEPVGTRTVTPVVRYIGENIDYALFSPDDHWLLYTPRTSQDLGIYVESFPGPGLRKQIARTGFFPVWRKDGKEILFWDQDRIWSIRVSTTGRELHFGDPEPLFSVRMPQGMTSASRPLAVSRDGTRIFFLQTPEQLESNVINVMTLPFAGN
ncbi:MAG: protein kinase [Bryobacteraceae bacterium]|jgi:serine/threonine-protein kinase